MADGSTVGCEGAVDVGIVVASTEVTRVGSVEAVGSRSMVWIGAGLHA